MTAGIPWRKLIGASRGVMAAIGILAVAQTAIANMPGERAQKANTDSLFGLTNKAFEGVEKLVELNLQAAKGAIGESEWANKAADQMADYEPPGQVLIE